jgi:GT2 family glycosyltransferase
MNYSACIATNGQANKRASLRLTIRALRAQSLPPTSIIVTINAEHDPKLLQEILLQSPGIEAHFANSKLKNVSFARNEAARRTSSEFLVFLDDDTILGGINTVADILRHSNGFDFSCGAKRFWAPQNWGAIVIESNPISYNMRLLKHIAIEPVNLNRKNGYQKLSNYSFIGNFGVVRRDLFEAIGGFDEEFSGWGYEDADLMQKLLHNEARFFLMETVNSYCIHLSHYVDKANVEDNIMIYQKKILERGKHFKLNHYFGVFEHDGWLSFSDAVDPSNN